MYARRLCTEFTPEALITYVYDECEPGERERVDVHLATCRACAAELESLRAVRGTLQAWTPPEPELQVRIVSDKDKDGQPGWWRTMLTPSWGLAAAATLVLVVGAAIAGIEIRYDDEGIAFRMGWTEGSGVRDASGGQAGETDGVTAAPDAVRIAGAEAPWLADLASLEDELRSELTRRVSVPVRGADPTVAPQSVRMRDDAPVLEQVEGLILESERRQRQELALWFTEFAQEFDMQRRADQQRVQQELGALEGVADYLVRVSQR